MKRGYKKETRKKKETKKEREKRKLPHFYFFKS